MLDTRKEAWDKEHALCEPEQHVYYYHRKYQYFISLISSFISWYLSCGKLLYKWER